MEERLNSDCFKFNRRGEVKTHKWYKNLLIKTIIRTFQNFKNKCFIEAIFIHVIDNHLTIPHINEIDTQIHKTNNSSRLIEHNG